VTERSEGLAQLSRLLGDDSLRSAAPDEARLTLRKNAARLVDGLVDEAAQSDDVFDRDSAVAYVDQRLHSLAELLDADLRRELSEAARDRIEHW
jgi:hypothetical protein